MGQIYYYILFESHEQAMKLHDELAEKGMRLTVSPTPRSASKCCGVSLMVPVDKYGEVKNYIDTNECLYKEICEIEQNFDSTRDVYI